MSNKSFLAPVVPLHVVPTFPTNLINLTHEQQEMVNRAKRYAVEQSIKNVLIKQTLNNHQQQQKILKRHQALILMCRVYVGSISFEIKEEALKTAFAVFGAIKSINMSWDPLTQKHKGFAFVEYELPEGAELAIDNLNGLQLGSRQIKVGRPANMPQAAPVIEQIQNEIRDRNRIYVSSVRTDLSEEELADIFEPIGKVRLSKLALTPNTDKPMHRGYGFVEFEKAEAATEALTMNNLELCGHMILRICRATTPPEHLSIYGTLETSDVSHASNSANQTDEDIQEQLERTNHEQESMQNENTKINNDKSSSNEAETNSENTPVILLKNMILDDLDSLHLDVYEECGKFGEIIQVVIYVHKSKPPNNSDDKVKIFVQFKDKIGAIAAQKSLNGQYFAGREVSACFYNLDLFLSNDYSQDFK